MKIKRYMAVSMRAALAQVRDEQGPEAVILSSRRVEGGIEVIAAVDYDEGLLASATLQRAATTVPVAAPTAAPVAASSAAPSAVPSAVPSLAPTAAPIAAPVQSAGQAAAGVGVSPATVTLTLLPTPERSLAPTAASLAISHVLVAPDRASVLLSTARGEAPAIAPGKAVPTAAMRPAPAAIERRGQAPAVQAAAPVPAAGARIAAGRTVAAAPRATAAQARVAPRVLGPGAASEQAVGAMRQELKELRQMLEGEFAGTSRSDRRLRQPLQARVLEELTALDIAPDMARQLAALAPLKTALQNPSHIPMALLIRHLPVMDNLDVFNGGVVALVGPTGAGKTTTVAKLAARWCKQHGNEGLALISTDRYRIGAREQLMAYARILGVPMHAADSSRDLARILDGLQSKKLILIDTAGMGPRDERLADHLSVLQQGAPRARVLLALPAQGEGNALEEIVQAYRRIAPIGCILTKVDEAASLGGIISTTLRHNLKIAYLCDGQRVPEDMHAAHQRRIWLVCAALKLKEDAPPRGNDGYYAQHFDAAHAHA